MPSCRQGSSDGCRDKGHHAQHVAYVGLASATDAEIWRYAASRNAVILTKDEDFAVRHRDVESPAVVWIRLGNTTNAALIRVFDAVLPSVEQVLAKGEPLVEIR